MKILTWNLQWAKPTSKRSAPILQRLQSEAADIAILTEARLEVEHSAFPHVVDAGPHPKSSQPNGSEVVIASRHPFRVIDRVGSPDLPERNFLAVDVDVPRGPLRVIGVVIRYNEKAQYIKALPSALSSLARSRTVLAGDFNLTMLGSTRLERQLDDLLSGADLRLMTAREWPELEGERPLIDHIAVGPNLAPTTVHAWPRLDTERGKPMTDHAGTSVEFSLT